MVKKNEKLATPEKIEGLPDLPALESVDTTDLGAIPVLLIMGAFSLLYTAAVVWGYLRYREFMDDSGKIMVGIVLLSAIWVVGRVAVAYSSFKTDRSGLTLRGPLRRRFILWTEIKKASTTVTRSGEYCVSLETVQGKVRILPRGFGLSSFSGSAIIVSIWQNLRQTGRAEGMLIPKVALSCWEPVPDDIPEEIDWGQPSTKGNQIGQVVLVIFLTAISFCLWLEIPHNIFQLMFYVLLTLSWLIMLKTLMIPEITRPAYVVNVRNSYLECVLLWSKVHIPWSDVASVGWKKNYLIIRTRDRREAWIRYNLGNKESENLIFALIRKLRTAVTSQVIALPEMISTDTEALNRQAYSGEQQMRLQKAFLNTLDEPVCRRIRRLGHLNLALPFVGMFLGIALGFSDIVGILARFIHAGSTGGTRFFIMVDTMFYGCVWMMVFMVGGGIFGEWLGFRLAAPYKEEWSRFIKVGNGTGKLRKVLVYAASVTGIISLLSIPLVIDCYARVTDKGFAVNHFFELRERVYPWNQVLAVEERIVSNVGSKSGSKSAFVIRFADGYYWKIDESNVRDSRRQELRKAIQFVAKKSGKEIVWR